jgi:hypothetical protein
VSGPNVTPHFAARFAPVKCRRWFCVVSVMSNQKYFSAI